MSGHGSDAHQAPAVSGGSFRRTLQTTSDISWRLLVVAAAVLAVGSLAWTLRIVLLPVLVATLLATAIVPLVTRFEQHMPALAATWVAFAVGAILLVGALTVMVTSVVNQIDGTGETIQQGLDDVEDWLVHGPLHLDRHDVKRYRREVSDYATSLTRPRGGSVVDTVTTAGELVAGTVLSVVLAFFFVKDGRRFQAWTLQHLPGHQRELARTLGAEVWSSLGAYVRGAALLGVVEGIVIGATVWCVGADLALPVGAFTFLAAFFPIVGAVVAGIMAVLVALATAGPAPAAIVLVVTVLVQQFDNDLLAPVIYGRALALHPVVILVSLTAGGTMGGVIGAFVAVPLAASVSAVGRVLWDRNAAGLEPEADAA